MSTVYTGSTISSAFSQSASPKDHLPGLSFLNNDKFVSNGNYNFDIGMYNDNTLLSLGEDFRKKMIKSRSKKAEKLGLVGREYSAYVEGVSRHVVSKASSAEKKLSPPPVALAVSSDGPVINKGSNLLDVLRKGYDSQGHLSFLMVEALSSVSQMMAKNAEMILQQNEILLEANKISEMHMASDSAKTEAVVSGFMSVAQSLEYIPNLIEAIHIMSDRHVEVANINNAHLMQKNVNDVVDFKYNVRDSNGIHNSLKRVADNLGSVAKNSASLKNISSGGGTSTDMSGVEKGLSDISKKISETAAHQKKIADNSDLKKEEVKKLSELSKHQEKMAKHSENQIKDWEDENSPEVKGVFEELFDFALDQFGDFDIFEEILKTRIGAKDE